MRLLHLVNEGIAGGVLRVAVEQTKHLRKQGHETLLVTGFDIPRQDIFFENYPFIQSKFKVCVPEFIKELLGSLTCKFVEKLSVIKTAPHNNPDWIISHNLGLFRDARKLRETVGSRIAVLIHNPIPSSQEKVRELLNRSDLVLATSNKMKEYIQKTYGLNSTIIYPGCSPLLELPSRRGDFILCAQRLSIGKRVHEVAKIIASVDKSIKVVFAGSTHRTTAKAIKKIKESGLKNFEVMPNISDTQLKLLYSRCRFFISIIAEPFGMNQLEAAAHGAVMICNASSGASELFENGIHGYFCRNEDEYREAIEKLLTDERKAWKMGYAAWNLCCRKYSWDNQVKKLIQVLKDNG